MRLILRDDVDGVGNKGDVVDVAAGFARNYLLPKHHAIVATKGGEAQAVTMRRARDQREAAARAAAEEVATRLVPQVITLKARAGGEGRLFGSVTTAEISDAVAQQTGVDIDRRRIQLAEPIKTLGTHVIPAKLHSDVEFPITIEVVSS
jgi:large subunit ribosomal protein L9